MAEDKKIKTFELAGCFEGFVSYAQAFINAHDVLVVDGEEEGGAGTVEGFGVVMGEAGDALSVAHQADDKAVKGVHAADGGEEEKEDEQDQKDGAGGGPARAPKEVGEEHGSEPSEQDRRGIKN